MSAADAASAWTRWYWPSAVGVAAAAMAFTPDAWEMVSVTFGIAILLVPEVVSLVRGRVQDTLSAWTWRVLDVVRSQPVSQWNAQHFLALGGYLALAARVLAYLWGHNSHAAAVVTVIAVWLTWHLFARWWA